MKCRTESTKRYIEIKRNFGKYVLSDMGVQLECKRAKTQIETDMPGMRAEIGTTEMEGKGVR